MFDILNLCIALFGSIVALVGVVALTRISTRLNDINSNVGKIAEAPVATPVQTAPIGSVEIENRPQFVAAVACAVATAMGTEPDGLRILSIRKI